MRILILRPAAQSIIFDVRRRWLAATFLLLIAAPWMAVRLANPGKNPMLLEARNRDPNKLERHRLANIERRLSLLKRHLERIGGNVPSDSGSRGGPVLPISLARLEQDAANVSAKIQNLVGRRKSLSAQLRRRYALDVPMAILPIGPPLQAAFDYTSGYGMRADPLTGAPTAHNGIDLAADYGATVVANAPGRVVSCENRNDYGLTLELDHGGGLVTRYAHLSACWVQVGARISRNQPVAAVGNSGRSTGPHLHYEVLVKGRAIDPAPFVLPLSTSLS